MLHELFIVLLLTVDYTSPIKKSGRLSRKAPHLPASCARVKCPREERPACARLVYRRDGAGAGNKTVYVVMLNECEINYVKCHEGLEAAIVPMKNCAHENLLKTRHMRAKRDLARESKREGDEVNEEPAPEGDEVNEEPAPEGDEVNEEPAPEGDEVNEEPAPEGDEVNEEPAPEGDEVNEEPAPEGDEVNEEPAPEGNEEAPEGNEEAPEGNEGAPERDHVVFLSGDPPSATSIQEGIEDVDYEAHVVEKLSTSPETLGYGAEDQELTDLSIQEVDKPTGGHGKKKPKVDWPYSGSASAELIFSFHGKEKKKDKKDKDLMDDEEPDMNEYQADCPKVCPARDMMVCARCQHAVYRTFLSVCHMRMFQCQHKDERLHLATRVPCMMSAPYLVESRMQQRGRVREAGDDDLVLRFIRCSALGDTSREDDPRCYLKKQKLMLQLETYNISDQY